MANAKDREGPYLIRDQFRPEPVVKLTADGYEICEPPEGLADNVESAQNGTDSSRRVHILDEAIPTPEDLAAGGVVRSDSFEGLSPRKRTETYADWLAKQPPTRKDR